MAVWLTFGLPDVVGPQLTPSPIAIVQQHLEGYRLASLVIFPQCKSAFSRQRTIPCTTTWIFVCGRNQLWKAPGTKTAAQTDSVPAWFFCLAMGEGDSCSINITCKNIRAAASWNRLSNATNLCSFLCSRFANPFKTGYITTTELAALLSKSTYTLFGLSFHLFCSPLMISERHSLSTMTWKEK